MDEIEKLLRANQGSTLTKQMVDKLMDLIDAYGNDQWQVGEDEGWMSGFGQANGR